MYISIVNNLSVLIRLPPPPYLSANKVVKTLNKHMSKKDGNNNISRLA
jgi:hypothetical protein